MLLAGALYFSFRDVSRLLFSYFFLIDLCLLIGVHLLIRLVHHFSLRVWIVPDCFDLALTRTDPETLNGVPLFGTREPTIDGLQSILKRTLDFTLSTLGLLCTAPLSLLIILAIKLDSPGPVLFKQQRVGENCRLFWMYKFRTMTHDAEHHLGDVIKK